MIICYLGQLSVLNYPAGSLAGIPGLPAGLTAPPGFTFAAPGYLYIWINFYFTEYYLSVFFVMNKY